MASSPIIYGSGHVAKVRGRGPTFLQKGTILGAGINNKLRRGSGSFINEYLIIYGGDGGGGVDTNGFVFITDVAPITGTVSDKIYDTDNVVLDSFTTDDTQLTVSVIAGTGGTHYMPVVTVNGNNVSLTQDSRGQWEGSVLVNISLVTTLLARHEDGQRHTTTITKVTAPVISDIMFLGYPGSQTSVKENDSVTVRVTGDSFDRIQIYDYQACEPQTATVAASTTYDLAAIIANRGSGLIPNQTVRVRIRSSVSGVWSEIKLGTDYHVEDGVGIFNLDSDYPIISSIAQGNIDYPVTQRALKASEGATVNHTVSPSSGITISYTSPNGNLSITNPSIYETAKSVTRIAGSYNVATTNFYISVTKLSNAATSIRAAVVYIADSACTLAVTEPAVRLRSGGNVGTAAQNHTITITASQNLFAAPTLVAPVGTWQASWSGSTTIWTRALQIHDNDTKGVQSWGAISATNLAGLSTTAITGDSQYTIGGFVFRTLTIAAWTNREGAIGTQVANTAKLQCTNLSKGSSGSLNFTFQSSTTDNVDHYTITQPTTVYNAAGNLWYNADLSNAVSNTSGTMQIELEEII